MVNKKSDNIEQSGEPAHYKDDVQSFNDIEIHRSKIEQRAKNEEQGLSFFDRFIHRGTKRIFKLEFQLELFRILRIFAPQF